MTVILFDIGDTLATPIFSETNDRLVGFDVFPEARAALEKVRARAVPLGIISNPGDERPEMVNRALEECGLFQFFKPELIFYRPKNSVEAFAEVAVQAGVPAHQCIFVGENSRERSFALNAGYRVAPHPNLVLPVLDGDRLVYARMALPASDVEGVGRRLQQLPLVPVHLIGGSQRTMYVITTASTLALLRARSFDAEQLGKDDHPLATDLYLVRDDRPKPAGLTGKGEHATIFLAEQGQADFVLTTSAEGVYLALPPDYSIEDVHFPGAQHGHNERLIPDTTLLAPFGQAVGVRGKRPASDEKPVLADDPASFAPTAQPTLLAAELSALAGITAEVIHQFHDPYIGLAPLNGSSAQRIRSRHIRHPDNARVTEALRRHLQAIGGAEVIVRRHRFQHENIFLNNIEADLPGSEPDSLVLITAHLDSTAAFSDGPYDPTQDSAPGADDDASGMAAVLAAAETLASLRAVRKPKRTLRFVFFNAEEHGLIGSKAYARSQAARGADITAVFQMDMIGFRKPGAVARREFEIHAGYPPSGSVEARSMALAQLIRQAVEKVSPNLNAPQIYPDSTTGVSDPAAGRSDHAAFHERGYAACAISEDFFAGPKADSPDAAPNPDYHKRTDRNIDYEYAADIARAVAASALLAANN